MAILGIHSVDFGGVIFETNPSFPGEPQKKKLITFHYTGWFIGIPTMVYEIIPT